MKRLVVASSNKHKIKEMGEILVGYELVPYTDVIDAVDIDENGVTFAENALIKAKTICALCGEDTVADDSGLVVDALGGEPGIYSARYSGKGDHENNLKVLENMKGKSNRKARFCCAVALCRPNGETLTAYGETEGEILEEIVGANGFGYDVIFFSDDLKMPMGLATAQQKNGVSHRARALKELGEKLTCKK